MKTILIACLLSLAASSAFAGRYGQTVGSDSKVVIADSVTSLQWTYDYSEGLPWKQALAYCEGLSYGGHSDWRLPIVNELRSLIYVSKVVPASDFPNAGTGWYWSSSSYVVYADIAWVVDFGNGYVNRDDKSNFNTVRCVRP